MVDFKSLLRRDILVKFVELALALLMVILISGRVATTNALKTEVVHATAFMSIAISLIAVGSSLLDSPVDERLLAVVTAAEALLFVVSGGLLMEGFKPSEFRWPASSLHVPGPFSTDWHVMGAGIVAFVAAVVHVFDMYLMYHICQSPTRPSVAVKRRFTVAGENTA